MEKNEKIVKTTDRVDNDTASGLVIRSVPSIVTEKGTTIEWCEGLPGRQVSIYYRKKGSHFANHYHTGSDPSKNPERFFLIQGKVEIKYRNLKKKDERMKTAIVKAGQEMLVYPYTYHEALALEDCFFIEYRETEFDQKNPDTLTTLH